MSRKGRARKTVVLTSRENFVWLSMREIIPFIEKSWRGAAVRGRHEVVVRSVDGRSLAELMPELLSADNIVFTCFTVRLCKLGELLRSRFAHDARYFIYLHNQATIACWPLHRWGLGRLLRESDVFISTSTADAKSMESSFERCRVEVIPFTLPDFRPSYRLPEPDTSRVPFVYAGRLSAQKNLHTLIYALRILRDAEPGLRWRLTVYGKDDHLGSPNMGMPSRGYGASLKALCRLLGLEEHIVFAGYRDPARLNRSLARLRHVAVSASLHSDENFGMAPFRSLCLGNSAVLTRWGGFADFARRLPPDQVLLAPVEETKRGPAVDPVRFARLLARAARAYRTDRGRAAGTRVSVPRYYHPEAISDRLLALALEPRATGTARSLLRMTALARRIARKQRRFEELGGQPTRIFESYADPDARVFFRGYRMAKAVATGASSARAPRARRCPPWVALGSASIAVRDPHRGELELRAPAKRQEARGAVTLSDWHGGRRSIGAGTAGLLRALGYSHR